MPPAPRTAAAPRRRPCLARPGRPLGRTPAAARTTGWDPCPAAAGRAASMWPPPLPRCRRRCWPAAAPPGALRRPCAAPGLPSATGWGWGPRPALSRLLVLLAGRREGCAAWQRPVGNWPERETALGRLCRPPFEPGDTRRKAGIAAAQCSLRRPILKCLNSTYVPSLIAICYRWSGHSSTPLRRGGWRALPTLAAVA